MTLTPKQAPPWVVSVSRGTDIANWHAEWFMRRLREGTVRYKNPMGPQVVTVSLKPEDVAALVFWTKNFTPMLKHLPELRASGIPFYTQFTLNDYPRAYEAKIASLAVRCAAFAALQDSGTPVLWRYDPIILSSATPESYHLEAFERLAGVLGAAQCHVSFMTPYAKTLRRMATLPTALQPRVPTAVEQLALVGKMHSIALARGMRLVSCAQPQLAASRVPAGACLDAALIERLSGLKVPAGCASRGGCLCVKHRDIGAYDTCTTGCSYCYAVENQPKVLSFMRLERDTARDSLKNIAPHV